MQWHLDKVGVYSGLIVSPPPPQYLCESTAQNLTVFENRVFADVVKVRLEMRSSKWHTFKWKCSYKRQKECKDRVRRAGVGGGVRSRGWNNDAASQGRPGATRSWKGKEPLLGSLEEVGPPWTFWFWTSGLQTLEEYISIVLSHPDRGNLFWQPQEMNYNEESKPGP